jgi:acyl-CoA dehydrogenase
MIDFGLAPATKDILRRTHTYCEEVLRTYSRYYDEHEHDEIKELEYIRGMDDAVTEDFTPTPGRERREGGGITSVVMSEEKYWGDAGLSLSIMRSFVGNLTILALGTDKQRAHASGKYAAFAITEPCCGSDTASIQTTAVLDQETNEWILNGQKIFITGGTRCDMMVVWASLDRNKGRAAMKSFLVDRGTPGMIIPKVENKLGFRASDTAVVVFDNCRIPYENILGSPEIKKKKAGQSGFQGAMKTFDMSRPIVASLSLGIGRAALDFAKEKLEDEGFNFPYNKGYHELKAVQKDIFAMEAELDAARLLVWRSAAMLDTGQRNNLEASMAKAKAGRTGTLICEKCVELLGPLGYSREWLVEKWMRDCKITDIFEGTGQINMLIVARNILGFSRDMLK